MSTISVRHSVVMVARGAMAGGMLGALDAFDTVLGGWTSTLPAIWGAMVVLLLTVVGGSAGTLVGGACAVPSSFMTWRNAWPEAHHAQALLMVGLGVASGGLAWGFRMLFPISISYVVCVALVAGIVGAVAAHRFRSRPAAVLALWIVALGWAYAIGARLLYTFSRHGVATVAHALWTVGLCVLAIATLSSPVLARMVDVRATRLRTAAVGALIAVAMLGSARTLLHHTPHAFRLVVYERTSLAYQLLAALPFGELTPEDLQHGCADTPPNEPRAKGTTKRGETRPTVRGVVLIMVDALRGDRVPSRHTPNLTSLGASALHFGRAYTTAPVTRLAAESMVTGASNANLTRDTETKPILKSALSKAGIRTIALSDHRHLEKSVGDFDVYERLTPEYAKANREDLGSQLAFERARHHLDDSADRRFFLMVHFYDPHAHYVPNEMFPAGASLEDRYDAEVAYADHYIGRLIDHIARGGYERDVAIMVVGDHGDEHWEHRYRWHRARVYDESVRVPILLRTTVGARGDVVASPVSIMDVAPTVLDLFGLPIPRACEGVSLLEIADEPAGYEGRALVVASDLYPTFALIQRGHKLVANLHTGVFEFYDLETDPNEQHNLADGPTANYDRMRCELARRLRGARR